jgi:hypothetical protein
VLRILAQVNGITSPKTMIKAVLHIYDKEVLKYILTTKNKKSNVL